MKNILTVEELQDYNMEKIKFFKYMIIILVILNVVTISFVWIQRYSPTTEQRPRPQKEDPGVVLGQYLGFTKEQQHQFDSLRTYHHSCMVIYEDSLRKFKEQLYRDLLEGDTADAQLLSAKIGEFHKFIEIVTFDHFHKVRMLCNSMQLKMYDPMLHRAITETKGARKGPPHRENQRERPRHGENQEDRGPPVKN
jgi:hypothetical protein